MTDKPLRYLTYAAMTILCFVAVVQGSGDVVDRDTPESDQPSAHIEAVCSGCHQMIASITNTESVDTDYSKQCRVCHSRQDIVDGSDASSFHSINGKSCTDCHTFHEVKRLQADHSSFVYSSTSESRLICQSCHNNATSTTSLSYGHRKATSVFHVSNAGNAEIAASEYCISCHSRANMHIVSAEQVKQAPLFATNRGHPVGIPVAPGTGELTLPLFNGLIECQTCHQLASGTENGLPSDDDPYGFCLECHPDNN